MKLKLNQYIPYVLSFVFIFIGLPLFMADTGTAMIVLLMIIPMCLLSTSIMFSYTYLKIDVLYLVLVEIFSLASIFIFMNSSGLIYAAVYLGIGLVGNIIGYILGKRKERTTNE